MFLSIENLGEKKPKPKRTTAFVCRWSPSAHDFILGGSPLYQAPVQQFIWRPKSDLQKSHLGASSGKNLAGRSSAQSDKMKLFPSFHKVITSSSHVFG